MPALAQKGSIWTVPDAGRDALCLVFSGPRGVARGRPEYQIIPLYVPSLLVEQSAADFALRANETSLGVALYAALWNMRPVLESDLGEERGRVVSEKAIADLRDASLQLADPSIRVPRGRTGRRADTPDLARFREGEIAAWQRVSGRALQRLVEVVGSRVFDAETGASFSSEDLEEMARLIEQTERLIGKLEVRASGEDMWLVDIALSLKYPSASPSLPLFDAVDTVHVSESRSLSDAPVSSRVAFVTGEFEAVRREEAAAA
jgi:hypothetical protein